MHHFFAFLLDKIFGRDHNDMLVYLNQAAYIAKYKRRPEPPIVFEGNSPANIRTNARLGDLIAAAHWP